MTALVGGIAARLLGLVLVVAAYAKALDPALFATQILELLPLSPSLAHAAAVAGVAFEAGLGAALLAGWRHPLVLAVTTVTFVVFLAIVAWQLVHPPESGSCGCFGALVERTPMEAFVEDVVFLVLSGLAWLGRTAAASRSRRAIALLGAVVGAGAALASPSLPLDDQATRLAPGMAVAATKLDEVVPELREGRHLVLLLDRGDPATVSAIAPLGARLGLPGGAIRVWGVAKDDPDLAAAFLWSAGPAFEVRSAPPAMLRTLYRTLPRSALVDGGLVVETWTGFPSDAELDALARGDLP